MRRHKQPEAESVHSVAKHEALNTAQCAQLVDLWMRRHTLPCADIGTMYDLVSRSLLRYNPPELGLLAEGRQELIAQFIYSKVLRLHERGSAARPQNPESAAPGDGHSAPTNAFALCAYFRRYLIDRTRASAFRHNRPMGDLVNENALGQQIDPENDMESCLGEYGLSLDAVSMAAIAFINQLQAPEKLLLCESFGKEAEGGLSAVAARHAIPSYHYRAGRLGLVHKRQNVCSHYARTQMGQWIEKKLGIPIQADNMRVILLVFKMLGSTAALATA